MYTPKPFREDGRNRLHTFIDDHAFGMLVVTDEHGHPEIAHLPFLLDPDIGPNGQLRVHVARVNRIWQLALESRPTVVIFPGPHGYVSPRWSDAPARHVPTWNYAVVHAHGRARGPMKREELITFLDDLVAANERGVPSPWRASDMEPAMRGRLMEHIVGFWISIEALEGKFKLSQNQSPDDRARVVQGLSERGYNNDAELVNFMTMDERND